MNIPRQFYGVNYISRLVSNFQDGEVVDCPKLSFSVIQDVKEQELLVKEPFELGMSAVSLSNMLRTLVTTRSCCLDGFGIAKDEYVICSGYRPPYSKEHPHITNSTCKTITAIAIMFAVSEGLLGVEDTVLSYFPEYDTMLTPKYVKQMTIDHLLTMTSGTKCSEIAAMVEQDWVKAFLLTDCQCEPGSQFIYNSMNTYMLSAILTKTAGMGLLEYLKPRLFKPLGINNVSWELCPKGIERGGWGLHLSIDGMLKIGLFIANNGRYNGKQLIDPSYIRRMKEIKVQQDADMLSIGYGYQLWHLPNSLYMLSGMYGQHVIIDEKNNLVIATNAHNDKMFPDSLLTRTILDCMNDSSLYCLEGKRRERAAYKRFLMELKAFYNGWDFPKITRELPLALYCKNQEKRFLEEVSKLKEICNSFNNRHLYIQQATFKLFPYMMRGMYQFPPFPVKDILFKTSENSIKMCFIKEPVKKERKENQLSIDEMHKYEKLVIKAGYSKYYKQTITIGPNEILLAAKVYLSVDEDGNTVMQLDMVFPAAGFSRKIKFFLLEDKISVECMEYPDMKAIVEQVVYGETVLAGNSIDLTGKLPEGLRVLMDYKMEPRVDGVWK